MLKSKIFFTSVAASLILCAHANGSVSNVSAIPVLNQHSPALDKSLKSLRAGILRDAKDCMDNAKGMDTQGQYDADIKKTIETPNFVGLQVEGESQCDGAHPNAYRYGISFDIRSGKRIDLNEAYAIGQRDGGSLFLTKKSVVPVMVAFKKNNAKNHDCLDETTFNDEYLMSKAFTMAAAPDGSLSLYFDVPYVEAACFSPIKLDAASVHKFRISQKADMYGLP